MAKTTFRISFRPDGKWQGTMEGEATPIAISHLVAEVKEVIFKRARELGNSRVLVFNSAGDETEERSFGAPLAKGYAGNWDL